MNLIGSLLKKTFVILSSKRRMFLLSSFFIFCGIFLVVRYTHATVGGVAITVVGGIAMIVVWIVGQIIALVTYVLIAVANYNDFSSSIAIITGWVVLRDVANMFFIIIFLVIAFGTMLGEEYAGKYHWKKALPRFIMMAILINFSKTIAGFIIDIGQVIMMTFVNGFSAAAGGNFLEVLRIRDLTSLTTYSGVEVSEPDVVGGSILAMLVAIISLICMTVLTMVLVVRVVALWLLVVVSPLAFFAAAVPMDFIQGWYGKWWKELTNNVLIGQILAFFIWLSLAVVSNTDFPTEMNKIAAGATAEETKISFAPGGGGGAPTGGDESAAGTVPVAPTPQAGPGAIGTPNIMLSYMIGIALLMGGLVIAKSTGAAGAGMAGTADSWIRKQGSGAMKYAQNLGKRAALAPVKYAGKSLRENVWDPAASSVLSLGARSGMPLLASYSSGRLDKLRGQQKERAAARGKGLGNLEMKELEGEGRALSRMPQTRAVSDRRAAINAEKLRRLKGKASEEEEKDKMGNVILGKDGKPKMINNAEKAQKTLEELESLSKKTGNKAHIDAVKEFKEHNAHLLSENDREKTWNDMNIEDLAKVNITSFKDKNFQSYLKKSGRAKDVLGLGPRKLSNERRNLIEGTLGTKKLEKATTEEKKEIIKEMGEDIVDKMGDTEITEEIINMMSGNQKTAMLKANKFTPDSFNEKTLKESANLVAMHGSNGLKESLQKKFGKNYGNIMAESRGGVSKKRLVPGKGWRYTEESLALSKEMVRSGKGLKESFNVDNSGKFKETADSTSFYNAISLQEGGDPNLLLNLGIDDIKGETKDVIMQATYNKDVLRDLVSNAKTDKQQDIAERIVQDAYEQAGDIDDGGMMKFIEGNRRMRQFVSPELKDRVRQKAEGNKKAKSDEIEKKRAEIEKRNAEIEVARAEKIRQAEEKVRAKAAEIFEKRMSQQIPGGEIDEMLKSKDIEPGTDEAEEFMKKWDWREAMWEEYVKVDEEIDRIKAEKPILESDEEAKKFDELLDKRNLLREKLKELEDKNKKK